MEPHSAPLSAHFTDGVQPHTLGVPLPPQLCGAAHAGPQLAMPPQPSSTLPQLAPAGQVTDAVQPHTLGVPPPPQVCGVLHAGPQLMVVPQPLSTLPQLAPAGHFVTDGVQPH